MLPASISSSGTVPEVRPMTAGDGTFPSPGTSPASGSVSYEDFAAVALGCWNELHFAARRLTRSAADADDLLQETYHSAFRNYRELRDLAKCRAWLYRILHRQAVTRYRRQHAGPQLVPAEGAGEASDSASTVSDVGDPLEHLSLQEIRRAVDALPTDLRIAVTLCDLEGFTYAEIADLTDCPLGTVRSRIARARAKLVVRLRAQAEAWGIRRRAACGSVRRDREHGRQPDPMPRGAAA